MRIFAKLFLLLIVLVALPLLAVLLVMMQSTSSLQTEITDQVALTGDLVSDKSELALLKQVELTHLKIIQEKAGRLEAFFESIRAAVQLQSTLMRQFLAADAPAKQAHPLYTADEVSSMRGANGIWKEMVFEKGAYAMYQLVQGVEHEQVNATLEQLRQLATFFQHAFHVIPGCASAYLGHRDGITFGYPGGSRFSPTYDPRQRAWYLKAQKEKTIIWTSVYYDRGDNGLIVTCAGPVYSPTDGALVGVAAMDVRLKELISELFALGDLKVSQAMLIDDEGLVRVSAAYEQGKAKFDEQTLLAPLHAREWNDANLKRAFAKILASTNNSGLISGDEGDDSLYIYANVRFRSQSLENSGVLGVPLGPQVASPDTGGGVWRYVLKVPLAEVVRPVQEIRADITGATDRMATTMGDEVAQQVVVISIITAVAMGVALLLAYLAARSATTPLIEMHKAADRIAQGNFEQHVMVRSKDEIGELGIAINDMIAGLKEREFVKKTFKRYVAASVVDALLEDHTKAELSGERREVTVFFSDLSGFTTLSETMPPDVLVALLNEYLNAMADAIWAYEGTIDKFIGDAIVAFWGAPIAKGEEAVRACRAALMNFQKLHEMWPDWERRGLPKLNMRIGIHTGQVVVGNIGAKEQFGYTTIGDTTNTASRLEGVNKFYGTRILIGEVTRRDAGDAIVAREIDLIAVKGKSEAIRVYELVGMKGQVDEVTTEALKLYEEALEDYRSQRWDQAAAAFERVIAMRGDDAPSRVFIERIGGWRTVPPGETWDGSFVLTEK